jgi:hypothetical protein
MKYFEKTAAAELIELKRVAAAIAKKNKKIKKVINAPVKVVPEDKAAVIHEKHYVATASSRRMFGKAKSKGLF